MTVVWLVVLCLALASTLLFVAAFTHDRLVAARAPPHDENGDHAWYRGMVDRTLVLFAVASIGLLAGLLLSGNAIDVGDAGVEAMLLAFGATAGERLLARQRPVGGDVRVAVAVTCLAAGIVGGLAGLGP